MVTTAEQRTALQNNPQALAAFEGALDATKLETATKLKEFRTGIATVLGKGEELTDEKIADIAESFVETGSFTFNGEPRTRDWLLAKAKAKTNDAKELAKELPYTAALLGADVNPESLIPTHEALTRPAVRIAEAVDENTGWMKKIGFAIKGFINWIIDLFNGGESKGLMEHIHMVGAAAVANSAHDKIAADMQKNTSFANAIGGAEGLRNLTYQVYDTALNVASGNPPKAKGSIAEQITGVEEVEQVKPEKWTATQVAASAAEIKTKISSMVQDKVNGFFDTGKNKAFWEQQANDAYKKASGFDPRTYWINADSTRDAVKTALGGGKPDQASKLIGDAVSEGVMQTFKGMTDVEINAALANPEGQSKVLAQKIAAETFATDDWKKIEGNIAKSTLEADTKTSMLANMKQEVAANIEAMIKEKSEAIKQAAPLKDGLIAAQTRVKSLNVSQLDKDGDKFLSYEEMKFLDKDGNRQISESELAALPDEMRKQFAEIMAKQGNKTLVKKSGEAITIDFSALDKIPPGTKHGLQIT